MSSIAAEGMFGELNANGFIEDHPVAFSKKAVELYSNIATWNESQLIGFKVLKERFNKTNFEIKFANRVVQLQDNLKVHRQNNFIGNLLQHQSLQSTKYMSKWIEGKNR